MRTTHMLKLFHVLPGSKNCTAAAIAAAAVSVIAVAVIAVAVIAVAQDSMSHAGYLVTRKRKPDLSRSSDQRVGAGGGGAVVEVAVEQAASLPESQVSRASVR